MPDAVWKSFPKNGRTSREGRTPIGWRSADGTAVRGFMPGGEVFPPLAGWSASRWHTKECRGTAKRNPGSRPFQDFTGDPWDHPARFARFFRDATGQVVPRRNSSIASADFLEMPGTLAMSSALAALMRVTQPNFSSKRRFLLGDMPGQSSNRLSRMRRR